MASFLQLHFLTSYPASLLNRDDAGFAKRIPFGGAVRTRVSSQCLKRHWRTFAGEHSLSTLAPEAVRSRLTFERCVLQPLLAENVDADLAQAVVAALMSEFLGQSARSKGKKDESEPTARTEQVTVLGRPEVEFILTVARDACARTPSAKEAAKAVKELLGKEGRKNLAALRLSAGLDGALFGRMVTSDMLSRVDAAVHVAHAMTVHEEASESDYFSAVDDLLAGAEDESLGSGHIGNTELTSGLFYGYAVVDVPLLVSNLEGCDRRQWRDADRSLAAGVIRSLVHLAATVTPGAKLGSTAPYAYAHVVLAEWGPAQPRTLANAFLKPVAERPDVVANAAAAMTRHISAMDEAYGLTLQRRHLALDGAMTSFGDRLTLPALADWAATRVEAADA